MSRFLYVDRCSTSDSVFDSDYTKFRLPFKCVFPLGVPHATKRHTIPQYSPARAARICANPATEDDLRTYGLHRPVCSAVSHPRPSPGEREIGTAGSGPGRPLAPVAATGSSGGCGVAYEENIPPDLLDLVTGGPVDGSEFEGHLLRYIIRIFDMEPPTLEASLQRTKPQRWADCSHAKRYFRILTPSRETEILLAFCCAYRYAGVMDVRSDIFPGTPDGFHLRDVSVRLARPDERTRWDAPMDQHHYLGFKRFPGRGLRYVFEWRGQWVGLAGWQSGAFNLDSAVGPT